MVFTLLIAFQIKHFLADYALQNKYMLGKFRPGNDFILPLLAHVYFHGVFTLIICVIVRPGCWWLALVDAIAHFAMDRVKANPRWLGRFKMLSADEFVRLSQLAEHNQGTNDFTFRFHKRRLRNNFIFWNVLGFDQMFHHLTHYLLIYLLMR